MSCISFLCDSNACRKNPEKDNARYMASCITILLINIPYFISINIIVLVWWILPDQVSFHEIIFAWIPIITSGLNPIIILSRKKDARKALEGIFLRLVEGAVLSDHSTFRVSNTHSSHLQAPEAETSHKSTVIVNPTNAEH